MTKTVLFWNFNVEKGDLLLKLPTEAEKSAVVARVAQECEVDVLALAECEIPDVLLLEALRIVNPGFERPANPHPRFKFFTRFPGHHLEPWHADGRLAVRRVRFEEYEDILLAAFHYLDRRNNRPAKQHQKLKNYKKTPVEASARPGTTG